MSYNHIESNISTDLSRIS